MAKFSNAYIARCKELFINKVALKYFILDISTATEEWNTIERNLGFKAVHADPSSYIRMTRVGATFTLTRANKKEIVSAMEQAFNTAALEKDAGMLS